jgi:two-component system, NarL family, response regulator YdfI
LESAPDAESVTTLTRVLIFADSSSELDRLSALVRSIPSLELAGAGLDRDVLMDQLEDLEVAAPVILLEHSPGDHSRNSLKNEFVPEDVSRIVLTEQAGFAGAIAEMKDADSAIRAVLPSRLSEREIHAAIEAVAAGLIVVHPEVLSELAGEEHDSVTLIPEYLSRELPDSPVPPLSPRESEILNLLADGLANKEIAWRLKISEHTVKFHLTSIFNKLDASTRAEAVAIGARRGLIIL